MYRSIRQSKKEKECNKTIKRANRTFTLTLHLQSTTANIQYLYDEPVAILYPPLNTTSNSPPPLVK